MEPSEQTFAETHLRQSHRDSQGCLLRNAELHLNHAQQRTCACKSCPLNFQQASNSPHRFMFPFTPPRHNQEKDWKQNGFRMEASSKRSRSYGEPMNQVVLYRWFLIRGSESSQGVEVSVGGFLTPGTAGTERFKTAAIVQRIEKCRLLAYDGLEFLLAGLIDVCTSVSNGFSLDGRPSKRQPHVGSDEDCNALDQIGAGNVVPKKSNDSTQKNVEKGDKCGQKPQLTPRITRSMQKTSRLEAHSHNVSVGVNTGAHSDSLSNCEEVHTPVEQCRPRVKLRSSTTASTIYQKRMDSKRSRRTLPKDNDTENIDGGKSSTASPCYYTRGKSPVEMGARRPESVVNAEAIPASKEEGLSDQKEACTLEAVQACDYGTMDEEEHVVLPVEMSKEHASLKSVEKLTKASQNKFNERESGLLSKSPGQVNKGPKIPSLLPRSRVPVSKQLIAAAFGLKTSRSGRLLVPPLAHWCSQGPLRDKDGGIIGIIEGSKYMNEDGYAKFMPPAEASLRKLRKQICEVAASCTPRRTRLGTEKRQ